MKWRKRSEPDKPDHDEAEVTVSEETRRARAAARAAAAQLAQVRSQTPKIEQTGAELEDLNGHNGFYLLIRQALGS